MCHFIYKILLSFLMISFGKSSLWGSEQTGPRRPRSCFGSSALPASPASAPRRGKVAGMTYRTTALRRTGLFTSSSASLSLPTPAGRHLRP